jgi:hypothetical protein
MSDSTPHEDAQVLARLTVLEHLVGMMVRDSMLKSGKGPQDILAYCEVMKKYFAGRTPRGATERQLNEAADRLFSEIASDIGSQDSQ